MVNDAELLHRYADDGSEAAFAELVRRNLDLVYSAALRHVGDGHRAEDVAQSVFIDLARKAPSLRRHPALVSWLYTSTRYAALKTLRSEQRRHAREQEAHTMQHMLSSDPAPDWDRLRPILDDVMHELGERDREIVLLRYFRGLPFADLAATLRLNEGAVRMRVDRALDKMNGLLARRGISSTAAALGVALGSQPAGAAPAGLAASVTGAALTSAVGLGTVGAVGTLLFMSKTKIAIVSLIVAGGIATAVIEHNRTSETKASLAALAKDRDALTQKVSNLTRLMAEAKARAAADVPTFAAPRSEAIAPLPVAQREEEPPVPGVSKIAPAGWHKNGSKPGSYVVGVDRNQTWAGLPSAYVKSLDTSVDGFGGMMQTSSAEELIGKRVRLSGWVKTQDANEGGGHLWLRVDGKQPGVSLQFDNMDGRAVKGTSDWQQYSVVLDVPQEATALAYGFFVHGGGQMWVSGTKMEPVGAEVPSTNLKSASGPAPTLPKTPVNLSFDPDHPK